MTLTEGACRPCMLCIIASGEKRLFALCWVRREESDSRSPPTSPSSRSNWLWVNVKKKSGQPRVSMQEESASSLKKRNGGIGAFSPDGYSTFTTRERDRERETSGGERAKVAAYSLWLRLYLSSTLLADSQRLTVWRHRNSRMSPYVAGCCSPTLCRVMHWGET